MRTPIRRGALLLVLVMGFSLPVQAQDDAKTKLAQSIPWAQGPVLGELGREAEVSVPAGCRFTGTDGTKTFLELTENPAGGNEQGVLLCKDTGQAGGVWFVIFSYNASGYVKDDEGKALDADAILKDLQLGTEEGNKERKARGWEPIYVDDWAIKPHYDEKTHNLTWATKLLDDRGESTINHSVRLLGRGGVMHADLVADPEQFDAAVPRFNSILADYHFKSGHTYAEWRQGDKMAGYGLTALVAGGATVAAAKSGLLAKLIKPIIAFLIAAKKLVIVAIAGIGAWLKSLFTRKKRAQQTG